ncbi:MAG: resolvase domain protein [Flavipsychrobacter sp.]|nr:resolvase domain protein [Flavipsychrobacter sp.]
MYDISLFKSFAKGIHKTKSKGYNCVIYTRVSTKEQADNNLSLETQKKACEVFAKKSNLYILGHFGGTYESAKTDERKEFNNMLSFLKKSKEKISYIIVYSVDRFSRSGANAIYIAEQLKTQGIMVFSVTQPTDASTASGSLQQNIQFIFSEYENQQRREKCMAGIKEMLLRGEWCTAPPIGYDIVRSNGKRSIVLNSKGKLLKKAFYWKAKEKLTSGEIIKRLAAQGLKIRDQRMSEFFRNPFYCGLIVHKALEGKVIEGNHEKMVSRELFLEANGVLSENKQGYETSPINDDIPLKRFYKCDECGQFLRAYKAYKNQKYYYKCNTRGCKCNMRADTLHNGFMGMISGYSLELDEDMQNLIREQITAEYNKLNDRNEDNIKNIEKQLSESDRKLERLEERYVLEEITREMYDKFHAKFVEERGKIENERSKFGKGVSNLELYIDTAFKASSKLATAWASADYNDKQALQFLVFPEGIYYNRKKDECRTLKVNEVFSYFAGVARGLDENNKGNCNENLQFPSLVASSGIEPESGASETLILSIVLRGLVVAAKVSYWLIS